MSNAHRNDCTPEAEQGLSLTQGNISWPHAVQPQDERQEEEFRREYQLQLERLSCPTCGEEPFA